MYKIYPSSAGFAWEELPIIDSQNACPRYILVAVQSPRWDIDEEYTELGAHHENWYFDVLSQDPTIRIEREVEIKHPITDKIMYSGRADFITSDSRIHETKATFSSYNKTQIIDKKVPKLSHVAQLATYLMLLQRSHGHIIVGYYEKNAADHLVLQAKRSFNVEIMNDLIYIDDQKYPYSVKDLVAHTSLVVHTLSEQVVPNYRPHNWNSFVSPCRFCPLASVCDKYDSQEIDSTTFIQEGIKILSIQPEKREVKFNRVSEKPKRRRKI